MHYAVDAVLLVALFLSFLPRKCPDCGYYPGERE